MQVRQADRIASALEEAVLTGQIQNGMRLDEASLAKRFGVSRTPVREALQALIASKLARQVPRRGVFVQLPNAMTLIEMFETMSEIEAACARLAATRINIPAQLDNLKQVNNLCLKAIENDDSENYSRHNENFHLLIYQMSGNAFLEKQALRLYLLLKPFRRVQFQFPGRMQASISDHFDLIDALDYRLENRAARVARDHVATQGKRFYHRVAQLRAGAGLPSRA